MRYFRKLLEIIFSGPRKTRVLWKYVSLADADLSFINSGSIIFKMIFHD